MKASPLLLYTLISLLVFFISGADAININNCSTLSTAGTTYTLSANVSNSTWNICMNVTVANVTLDCQNYYVDGVATASTWGVFVNSTQGFTLRNCFVSDWGSDVYVNASNNTNLSNNWIYGSQLWGAEFYNTFNTSIQDNQIGGIQGDTSPYRFNRRTMQFSTVAGDNQDNDRVYFYRNRFLNKSGGMGSSWGIYFAGTPYDSMHEIVFEYNNFSGLNGVGTLAYVMVDGNYSNMTFRFNSFSDAAYGGLQFGLNCALNLEGVTVYNNSFSNLQQTGIYLNGVNGSNWNVSNNAFNILSTYYYAIYGADGCFDGNERGWYNTLFYNNSGVGAGTQITGGNSTFDCAGATWNGTGLTTSGVFVGSYNTTLKNCKVADSVAGVGAGLGFSTVFNNSINNVYLAGGLTWGIYIASTGGNVSYNYVENVTGDDPAVSGASPCLWSYSSSYNKIHDNVFTKCEHFGVYDYAGTQNEYYRNTINVSNFSIVLEGYVGGEDRNISFHNNVINGSQNASFMLQYSVFNASSVEDVVSNSLSTALDVSIHQLLTGAPCDYCDITFTNSTFDKSKVVVNPASTASNLTVKWHTRAYVVDLTGIPIASANVNISNSLNKTWFYEEFNQTTDALGLTPFINSTEFFLNQTDFLNFTPHYFVGIFGNYFNLTLFPISEGDTKTIVLSRRLFFVFPTPSNANFSGDSGNNWIYINTSYFNTTPIDTVVLNWNGANETGTMDCSSGYNCFINKTGLVWGNYSFYVFLNQTAGTGDQTEMRWAYLDICGNIAGDRTLYTNVSNRANDCFTIVADNISLDCAGLAVVSSNLLWNGVYSNYSNTTIRNCIFENFRAGIFLNNSAQPLIISNSFIDDAYGLFINSTTGGLFVYNSFQNNSLADINITNSTPHNFTSNSLFGTLTDFYFSAADINFKSSMITPATLPTSLSNGTSFIEINTTDPTAWVYMNISWASTMHPSSLALYEHNSTGWHNHTAAIADSPFQHFIINATSLNSVYAILGCLSTQPYFYHGYCYMDISLSSDRTYYKIGDAIALFATPSASLNVTHVILYYADLSGTSYLQQPFIYNNATGLWFGAFKLRQYSEYLQIMAFDNSTGNFTTVGYGFTYLVENPPPTWFDYFFWLFVIIGAGILFYFVAKWFWEGI